MLYFFKDWDIASRVDDTITYTVDENCEYTIITIFEWFYNNLMIENCDKSHFLISCIIYLVHKNRE